MYQELHFQFKPVWTTHFPTRYGSMMMKKGSQYTRIFTQAVRRLEKTGNIDLLRKRYKEIQACKPLLKEKVLGFEKLSFIFVMLMLGSILSILVMLLEHVNQQNKQLKEITTKHVKISLIIEEVYEYMNGFGLSNLETENILGSLYQKQMKKYQEDDLLNMNSDEVKFKLHPKNCPL